MAEQEPRHQGNAFQERNLGPVEEQAFRAQFHGIIGVAFVESTNRASANVEAEHVLLAFLFDRSNPLAAVFTAHGLTYQSFDEALVAERRQTLAAVGVAMPDPERLRAAPRVRGVGRGRFGTTAREAMDRAIRRARARRRNQRLTYADLAFGILSAELGTVPRALALAGIDRQAIIAELGT